MTKFNLLSPGVEPKFPLGAIAMTTEAFRRLPFEDISAALARHAEGDCGDVCPEDRAENERALVSGGRLFSVYHDGSGLKFWIITEADRSATTVLLPEDY
jgi:hypothetical protein